MMYRADPHSKTRATMARYAYLLVLCLGLLLPLAAQAQTLAVDPGTSDIVVDEEVVLDIQFTDVPQFKGIEFTVTFDNAIVELVEDPSWGAFVSQYTPLGTPAMTAMNASGSGTFTLGLFPGSTASEGTGTVVSLRFKGTAAGTSAVALSDVQASDPNNQPISLQLTDGQITVAPPTWTLRVLAPTGTGSTNPDTGDHEYDLSTSADVTATGIDDWALDFWLVDGTDVGDPNPISIGPGAAGQVIELQAVFDEGMCELFVEPGGVVITEGEEVTLDIELGLAPEFKGIEFTVEFDNSILEVSAAPALGAFISQYTPVSQSTAAQMNADGTGTFAVGLFPGNDPSSGDGTVLSLTFRGIAVGTSPITLSAVQMSDMDNQPISVDLEHGQVIVEEPPSWTLRVLSPVGSGTTSPVTGDHAYDLSTSADVTATPAAGWKLSDWEVAGVSAGTTNPLAVGPGTEGQVIAVQAIFVQETWTLNMLESEGEGTTDPVSPGTYILPVTGENYIITATPSEGWEFEAFVANGTFVHGNPIQLIDPPDGQVYDIKAIFIRDAWTLDVLEPSGSGSTSPATGTHSYNVGESAEISATPETGWTFDRWEGPGVPAGQESANPLTVPSGAAGDTKAIRAVFVQQTWTLRVLTPTGDGSTGPGIGDHSYDVSTSVDVTATPAAGWKLSDWEEDGASAGTANPLTVGPGTDGQVIEVRAIFVRETWTLDVQAPSGSGTTSPATGMHVYNVGDDAEVSADPTAGWTFDRWEGSGVPAGQENANPLTVPTGADGETKPVRAVFVQQTWTLRVLAPTGNGTTSPSTGDHVYTVATSADVAATPATGWKLSDWEEDGASAGTANPLTVGPGTDGQVVEVRAIFVRETWTLDVQAPSGSGTTTPATGMHVYNVGDDAEVSADPTAGWTFDRWEGSGVPYGHEIANPLTVPSGVADEIKEVRAVFVEGTTPPPACSVKGGAMYHFDGSNRASLHVHIERRLGGELKHDTLRLMTLRPRFLIVSTSITHLDVDGNTAYVQGICNFNGTDGCTYDVTIIDGSPDYFSCQVMNGNSVVLDIAGDVERGKLEVSSQ